MNFHKMAQHLNYSNMNISKCESPVWIWCVVFLVAGVVLTGFFKKKSTKNIHCCWQNRGVNRRCKFQWKYRHNNVGMCSFLYLHTLKCRCVWARSWLICGWVKSFTSFICNWCTIMSFKFANPKRKMIAVEFLIRDNSHFIDCENNQFEKST